MNLHEYFNKIAPEFGFNLSEAEDNQVEQDVLNQLDRSAKFDEIDSVTFGLETDDGKVVKVYVNSEQAEEFEKALAAKLGEIDDIEEVLNELSKEFEIVDVEWPSEDVTDETDSSVADGSEVLDKQVYKDEEEEKMEDLTLGEKFTVNLQEDSRSIETRFTTATQLMIYHAIIDLGIPELALNKSPYRATIVKNIREKALELSRNSAMKQALKLFISRSDDYEARAKKNDEEEKSGKSKADESIEVKSEVISETSIQWSFELEDDLFTVACKALKAVFNAEETEKIVKGITNRDAVVVRDADTSKKIVFSPRGSSVLVKHVGSAESLTMTSKDVDKMLSSISPEDKLKESVAYICKFSKDGKLFSLWNKGNYWYELTHSTQGGEGYKHVKEWHKETLEDITDELIKSGYKQIENDKQ